MRVNKSGRIVSESCRTSANKYRYGRVLLINALATADCSVVVVVVSTSVSSLLELFVVVEVVEAESEEGDPTRSLVRKERRCGSRVVAPHRAEISEVRLARSSSGTVRLW